MRPGPELTGLCVWCWRRQCAVLAIYPTWSLLFVQYVLIVKQSFPSSRPSLDPFFEPLFDVVSPRSRDTPHPLKRTLFPFARFEHSPLCTATHNMDTQQPPELYDEDMASQDSAPISTPADIVPTAVLAGKQALINTDIEMKDEQQNIHAPPSPAPSGDSQHAPTTLHHLNRPSPSPMSAPSFSAGDHPETSIPSPASPSGADSLSADVDIDPPAALATPTKHEHDDDEEPDAMIDEDQRPAKRARTADVASVSVFSLHYHVPAVAIARHTGCPSRTSKSPARGRRHCRFVCSTCIVHRVLTALHIHMHSFMFASGAVVSITLKQKISFSNSCNCSPLHRPPWPCHRYQQWRLSLPQPKVTLHRLTLPCPLSNSSSRRAYCAV